MKRQGAWAWLVAAGMLAWAGCDTPPACKTPGSTRTCACDKGQSGVQRCLPERVWDRCMCSSDARMTDAGSGGASVPTTGGTGGTGGATGSGGSTQPSSPMTGDDDGGGDASPMSSTGGSGAVDAGGGTGGMSASDSGTPPVIVVDAYTPCTTESECKPAGSGCLTDASGVLGSACQPKCNGKNDCPVPAGNYTAVVTCNAEKRCVLDCSPSDSDLTPGTCPGALECHLLADTSFACLTPAN
jgi:hypothetical protein